MTKSEFATRLLFWLLPWPISKALPRALRIYYFGPTGEPLFPWPDFPPIPPDWTPSPEEPLPPGWPPTMFPPPGFEPTPEDPLPPGWDPTPLPPPQWLPNPDFPQPPDWDPGVPAPPDAIVNPGDPYLPGPGHPDGAPQPGGPPCTTNCDNTYWTPTLGTWDLTQNIWNPENDGDGWKTVHLTELGTWVEGYRPVFLRLTCGGPATIFKVILVDAVGHELAGTLTYSSGSLLLLSWLADDIDYITIRTAPPDTFSLINIEFL